MRINVEHCGELRHLNNVTGCEKHGLKSCVWHNSLVYSDIKPGIVRNKTYVNGILCQGRRFVSMGTFPYLTVLHN